MKSLLETCKAYMLAQASHDHRSADSKPLAVTISREMGAGALIVARHLADYLQTRSPDTSGPWAVFEQNLISRVLADHLLPERVGQYMPEDSTHLVSAALEEVLGLHPNSSTLVQQTAETIFDLAGRGNVILIGRGSNVITSRLKHVFHVRLVAPLEVRIEHIRNSRNLSREEAERLITDTDRARERYVRQNFSSSIGDPLGYHLTINTARLDHVQAAKLIGDAALSHRERYSEEKQAAPTAIVA